MTVQEMHNTRENQIVLFLPLDGSAPAPFRWTIPLRLIVQERLNGGGRIKMFRLDKGAPYYQECMHLINRSESISLLQLLSLSNSVRRYTSADAAGVLKVTRPLGVKEIC